MGTETVDFVTFFVTAISLGIKRPLVGTETGGFYYEQIRRVKLGIKRPLVGTETMSLIADCSVMSY